jgi:septum site-determining protein MinD
VPEDESVLVSSNRGIPVVLDGKSKAGLAFSNIARRLSGEEVPFMEIGPETGFLNRLSRIIRPGGD